MTLPDEHLVGLPGTGWAVWRDAVLRTAGFPATGTASLAAPDCAAAADGHLDGERDLESYLAVYAEARRVGRRQLRDIAADPRFVEAITWQNPGALHAIDGLIRSDPDKPLDRRRRGREYVAVRYWQRYCAKNDTIGFFGPNTWITIDPDAPAVQVTPGPRLLRDRTTYLEHWAVTAYADRLAADPDVHPWFPPLLHAHLTLADGQVRRPALPPVPVNPTEAAVLAACDGRPAALVARALVADADSGVRKESDAYLILDRLAERGVLSWDADLPVSPDAEAVLRDRLAAIEEPAVRDRALAGLDRITSARDRVAAAAGDPAVLRAALAELDVEFTAVTGADPRRRGGEMYAGRALCYEDTSRDLDVVIGAPVLAALAGPLEILLQASRWLSVAVVGEYEKALRGLYDELAAELGTAEVPLADLWYLAQGLLFGTGERPADRVSAELIGRWATLFALDRVEPGQRRVTLHAADLAERVAEVFPADRPGWSQARLHSPDLHLCAGSAAELAAGDFFAVLGELHAAWPTLDSAVFALRHPEPDRLRSALHADVGPSRLILQYPADWPRYTGRVCRYLDDETDTVLAFAPSPGAPRDRLLPVTTPTVAPTGDGRLAVHAPDGREWPLAEAFGELLAIHTADAFKLVGAAEHTPRITIDRLVVARETWRTTVAGTGVLSVENVMHQPYLESQARYFLAARQWQRRLGLPDRVFFKLADETKPCYLDFTSPLLVAMFVAMLRSARDADGGEVALVLTEALPGPEHAWVPDAEGRRYTSELRLHVRDPMPAGTADTSN